MTHRFITTLLRIVEKPSTSKRDELTIARRLLRVTCQHRREILNERHAMRRQARKLRQFLPFTKQQVVAMDNQAREHKADLLKSANLTMVAYGGWLLRDPGGIAAALGFDQLADHLSINPVHREQARHEGGETLQGLVFIARMEDSATSYGDEWGNGGPLFEACHATMVDFIRTCPEHLLPDPFAPGEVFGPKLPPTLRAV